jgi:hypothetical protein
MKTPMLTALGAPPVASPATGVPGAPVSPLMALLLAKKKKKVTDEQEVATSPPPAPMLGAAPPVKPSRTPHGRPNRPGSKAPRR